MEPYPAFAGKTKAKAYRLGQDGTSVKRQQGAFFYF
jgi:hypothetical protein